MYQNDGTKFENSSLFHGRNVNDILGLPFLLPLWPKCWTLTCPHGHPSVELEIREICYAVSTCGNMGSISVSGQLPTYPYPNPPLTCYRLTVVGLGEG